MADRGRDLKVSILSDADRFDVDQPARDLDKLAERAEDADKALTRLGDGLDGSGRRLRDLGDDSDKSARKVGDLGTDAKDTARKVDDAFDRIARSSKAGANKVDDATDKMSEGIDGVKDEALDTGREMAASFSGGVDDIMDAGQELLANAGTVFGPVGIAIGIALASGFAKFRAEKEKLEEDVQELTETLIEGAGQIERESILAKLQQFASDGSMDDLAQSAKDANINVQDFLLALAGDQDALERTQDALKRTDALLKDMDLSMAGTDPTMVTFFNGLETVRSKLGEQSDILALARDRYDLYNGAAQRAGEQAVESADSSGSAWDNLGRKMSKPIRGKVSVDAPSAGEIAGIRSTIQSYFFRNPVTVAVNPKPGQGQGYGVVRARP